MGDRDAGKPTVWWLNLLLIMGSLLAGFGLVEVGYRIYLYGTLAINTQYYVATINTRMPGVALGLPGNVRGPYPPGLITYTYYTASGDIWQRIRVPVNNLGWISRYDISCQKRPSEYRIAIVGDSMTASINNEKTWPDLLQDRLNADSKLLTALNAKEISVLNLGIAGASMIMMANPLAVIARRFSADMVIVNFPIEDLARRVGVNIENFSPEPREPPCTAGSSPARTIPNDSDDINIEGLINIDGVEINLYCASPPIEPANPTCKVNPVWYVPSHITLDKAAFIRVKRKVARMILWHRVVLSPKPLALMDLLGRPIIPRGRAEPVLLAMKSGKEAKDIEFGLKALQAIKSMHDEVLISHNILYWHLTRETRPAVLDKFISIAKKAGIHIIQMEDYMPIQRGEKEWFRWYNLPHDGHWSDYGAEIYSRAMYRVIRERLFSQRGDRD